MHWLLQRPSGQTIDPIAGSWRGLLARVKPFALTFAVWTGVGLCFALPGLIGGEGSKLPMLFAKLIDAWSWALLMPAVMYVEARLGYFDGRPYRKAAILLLLSVPFAAAHTLLTSLGEYPFDQITWTPLKSPLYAQYYVLSSLLTYGAVFGSLQAFRYYNQYLVSQLRIERMEKSLLQSHLNTLRLQIEPHFLFNTLNTISSVAVGDPNLARDMIEDLGTLLRRSLDYRDKDEISLGEELSLLECYLSIQQVRFGDRLRVHIEVPPGLKDAQVPCFLLQPLVENAIRHGISCRAAGGTVSVIVARTGGKIDLRIIDDGIGLPPQWRLDTAAGLGLKLTKDRLDILYQGEAGSLDVRRREQGGTEVAISLPLRMVGDGSNGTHTA